MSTHRLTMLGTGLIGLFYTQTLHGKRNRDRVEVVYSRSRERAAEFADRLGVTRWTTSLDEAVADPDTDAVVIGLPNHLHEEAVELCARHGKAVLCTKPLARNSEEAKRLLDTVERAGVFAGYLEDLVYTPKTLKAVKAVQSGQIGDVTWARSRETHPGPTARGSGTPTRPAEARSSISAATASRSSGTTSARTTARSTSCAGSTRWFTPSRPRTTPSH